MPDMNSTSRKERTKHSQHSLWQSIQTGTGRKLLACGSRLQAMGAGLIFRAERNEPASWRTPLIAFATVSALAIIAFSAWADTIPAGFTAREMRAGASTW